MSVSQGLGIETFEVEFGGQRYAAPVKTPFLVEGRYELYLQKEARDLINRFRDGMSAMEYELQIAVWQRDCGAKRIYTFDGVACRQSLQSEVNQRYFAWLHFSYLQPELPLSIIERMWQDATVKAAIEMQLFRWLNLPLPVARSQDTSAAGIPLKS